MDPVKRFYRFHALIYNATRWTILHRRESAVAQLDLSSTARVLEVGCGTGHNFKRVARRLDPQAGGMLVGLDFSQAMLKRARQRIGRNGWSHVHAVCGDATRMQFAQPFDRIFFSYSLTMIPDSSAVLARCRELLAPGGVLVVHDFGSFESWGALGAAARKWLRWNHVVTQRVRPEEVAGLFDVSQVSRWLGGYCLTVVARG